MNHKQWQIGSVKIDGQAILAPMAGVSDIAYRLLAKEHGAALVCTEMVSAMGIKYKNERTHELLRLEEVERPVSMQIFGSNPEAIALGAKVVADAGADIVDINMGCPAPKIVNNGDGSALMKNPELAGKIISAVRKSVNCPMSVKFRMGWDDDSINAVEFAKTSENNGADAITIHGRTRAQFYSGKANLEIIKKVKEAVKIPVIGNGDVHDGKSAKYMLDYTGCDGIMIGRAAQGNPWLFSSVLHYLKTGDELAPPTLEERSDIAEKHLRLLVKFKGEYRGVLEGRKHMAWYFKGLCGGAKLRNLINQCDTLEQMLDLISYENLRDF